MWQILQGINVKHNGRFTILFLKFSENSTIEFLFRTHLLLNSYIYVDKALEISAHLPQLLAAEYRCVNIFVLQSGYIFNCKSRAAMLSCVPFPSDLSISDRV
jgi:hypothetical protein